MDGVTTDKDRCPATRPGAEVNIYGCENDDDRDGVPNHRDDCPDTRSGARTDVRGCEIKDVISLPGVNFETGHDVLLPGTEYLLQNAADTLNKHPELRIEVAGHSDDVGNADQNIGLSMRRAKTVMDFLIRYGVAEDRLSFRGYGESQPIADNDTAEGRATNRRVELRLVSN
jgi:outer membrane protein OmpA-like peptidoglycan-associated protein